MCDVERIRWNLGLTVYRPPNLAVTLTATQIPNTLHSTTPIGSTHHQRPASSLGPRVLRFGNLGTTVAIGRGQSEKLHLDVHDEEKLPTILMVLTKEGEDWDHSDGKGDIILPTLGLTVFLYPGDVFIFYASLLPHQVRPLPESEGHKRTVATLFTCTPARSYLEGPIGGEKETTASRGPPLIVIPTPFVIPVLPVPTPGPQTTPIAINALPYQIRPLVSA